MILHKFEHKTSAINFLFTTVIAMVLVVSVSVSYATDKQEVKKEVQEAMSSVKEYSIEQRDAALAKAEKLMGDIDSKINDWEGKFEANWSNLKDTSREEYYKSRDNIRKMRNNLSEWYGGMKHSSKEAWGAAKEGFAKTYEDVVDALQDSDE